MGRVGLLACLGLAALAIGCGVEPTPEEESADPAALAFVKPPRIPIVRPALPPPPSAAPCPSPLPSSGPTGARSLTDYPGVREQGGVVGLDRRYAAPSTAPRVPCDPPYLLEPADGQPREE